MYICSRPNRKEDDLYSRIQEGWGSRANGKVHASAGENPTMKTCIPHFALFRLAPAFLPPCVRAESEPPNHTRLHMLNMAKL